MSLLVLRLVLKFALAVWGFYLSRFCLPIEGTLRAMLPKQQTKDARYKPIDTEKPYTKKHLKAGDTKLALPYF